MAVAKLEFNLDDEDDLMLFNRINKSTDMANALWSILFNTKKSLQWEIEANEDKFKEDPYELLDRVYSKIWQIVLEDNDINIEKLIN
jgi:hypothetical protein